MDTQPGPRCSRSDEPADSAWASGRQIPERIVSRGGTEGTRVAYMPITPLDDLVMPSLAPEFGPFKFFYSFTKVLRPQGSCLWRAALPWLRSLAAQPGARAVKTTPPSGGAAQRFRSREEPFAHRPSALLCPSLWRFHLNDDTA